VNKASIQVPEYILCENSDFFKEACSSPWPRGKDRTVRLDDRGTEEPIFSIFLAWIFTKEFSRAEAYVTLEDNANEAMKQAYAERRIEQLFKCFVLGERLHAPAFQDTVINQIRDLFDYAEEEDLRLLPVVFRYVPLAFCDTPEDSPLRRLIVQYYCCLWDGSNFNHISMYNVPFGTSTYMEFYQEVAHAHLSCCKEKHKWPGASRVGELRKHKRHASCN